MPTFLIILQDKLEVPSGEAKNFPFFSLFSTVLFLQRSCSESKIGI